MRLRIGASILGGILSMLGLASPTIAQSGPPSIVLSSAPLISPSNARSYFGTGTTRTTGVAARTSTAAEIAALARSLGSEQLAASQISQAQYIDNVVGWVRNNVEVEFRYGLSKGAVGALIDLHGSPFDQADLVVALLRAGNVSASFQLGDVTMQATQFGHWTGLARSIGNEPAANADLYQDFSAQSFVVDAASACSLFADGGIPAVVNGASSCSGLSGVLTSSVTFSSAWVLVNGQAYDPSLKAHILRGGIDLPAAMGCGTQSASTCGTSMVDISSASASTSNGATTVNKSDTSVKANFEAKSQALLTSIRTGGATRRPVEVVGGKEIAPSAAAFTYMAGGTSYAAVSSVTDVPDQYRTTLTVTVPGYVATCAFYGDELAGQRLSLMGMDGNSINIAIENQTLRQGADPHPCPGTGATAAQAHVILAVNHPYASQSGTYGDRTIDFALVEPAPTPLHGQFLVDNGSIFFPDQAETSTLGSYPIVIVHGFGDAAPSAESHMMELNRTIPLMSPLSIPCRPSVTVNVSTAGCPYANMALTAEQIRSNTSSYNRMVSGVTKATVTMQDQIGVVYSGRNFSSKYVTVSAAYSISPNDAADTGARQRSLELLAVGQPVIESLSMNDRWRRGFLGTFEPRAVPNGSLTLMVPPSAMASVLAAIPTLAPSTLNQGERLFETEWRQRLQAAANAGYTVLMNNGWDLQGGEVFLKNGEVSYTFWGAVKGGQATDPFKNAMAAVEVSRDAKPRKDYSSISLSDGGLSLTPPADLVTGSGDFPYSLPFQRAYQGGAYVSSTSIGFNYYLNGPSQLNSGSSSSRYQGPDQDVVSRIGGGWTHNYNVSATLSFDTGRSFGDGNAVEATNTMVALVAMNDFARALATSPTLLNRINLFSFQRYLDSVAIAVVKKGGASEAFTVLADNQYQPQTNSGSKLTTTGAYFSAPISTFQWNNSPFASNYTYTSSDGDQILFNKLARIKYIPNNDLGCNYGSVNNVLLPVYTTAEPTLLATSWTWPNGMTVNFSYDEVNYYNSSIQTDNCHASKANVLKTVSNSLGRSITFNYSVGSTIPGTFYTGASQGVQFQDINVTFDYVINSIQDENGRTVNFSRSNCYAGSSGCETVAVTNPASEVTTYKYAATTASPDPARPMRPGYRLRSWTAPTSPSTDAEIFLYDEFYRVRKVTDINNIQTSYFAGGLLGAEGFRPGRRRDSIGESLTLFDGRGNAVRAQDELGNATRSVFDGAGRQIRQIMPEGNEVRKKYDIRSNLLEQRVIAKPDTTTLPDIVTKSTYVGGEGVVPYLCVNAVTCNKTSTDEDAKGAVSNYSYNTTTGDLTQILKPSVLVNGSSIRPQVDLGYTSYNGIAFLTSKTEKIDASQSVTTNYTYDSSNRYVLGSVLVDPGGLNLRSCFKYDAVGNLIASTEPKGAVSACP